MEPQTHTTTDAPDTAMTLRHGRVIAQQRGPTWKLEAEQWLPVGLELLFPFFADAHNLERITPPFLRFEVLTPAPIPMAVGTLIDYRIRLHGLPIRWRTRIADWQPGRGFVDEQLSGPYRQWHHVHRFVEQRRGDVLGTLCTDEVTYRVPGGPLSPLVQRLFVGGDVERIFRYRGEQLAALFGAAAPSHGAST